MSLSCHNSSPLDDIVQMSAPNTRLIIILSDITFTLRVIVMEEGWRECLRFRHLAWEEMSWPDIHLQNMQLPSWLYISLHQDLSLWSFHIIHSTLSVEHLLLLQDIGPALMVNSPGYYHSLCLHTNVTNNKSELWPICDTINFPIRGRSQWRYIPSNDSRPHYIISLNTAPPFMSQCAHTP